MREPYIERLKLFSEVRMTEKEALPEVSEEASHLEYQGIYQVLHHQCPSLSRIKGNMGGNIS